jgi:hypothetical protein
MPVSAAALAIDPFLGSGAIVFPLPDRHTLLDLINDIAAGIEGGIPMGRYHNNADRNILKVQKTIPMDGSRRHDRKLSLRLDYYNITFRERQFGINFILESLDGTTCVMISYTAFKANQTTY